MTINEALTVLREAAVASIQAERERKWQLSDRVEVDRVAVDRADGKPPARAIKPSAYPPPLTEVPVLADESE
jgi:hypothetical protein